VLAQKPIPGSRQKWLPSAPKRNAAGAAELAEVRAQLKDAFESARDDARSIASKTVSAEVARAENTLAKTAASLAASAGKQAAVVAVRASVLTLKWVGRRGCEATPIILEFVRDLPPRVLATAATLLLMAGSVAVVGVASLTKPVRPLARTASNTAIALFGAANHAGTVVRFNKEPGSPVIPVVNRISPRPKPVKELKPLATGWLAVFSRVPLDLYVAGRRIGSTNDDGQIVLPAGRYKVELVSKEFNYQGEVVLDIRGGRTDVPQLHASDRLTAGGDGTRLRNLGRGRTRGRRTVGSGSDAHRHA
jgi:hypothetical protein